MKQRVLELCSDMDEAWWERVREAQLLQTDYWEMHFEPQGMNGERRPVWVNWVTGERQGQKPDTFA